MGSNPKQPYATLTLIVDYYEDDDGPVTSDDVESVVDEARNFGTIRVADFETFRPSKVSLK